MIVLHERVFLLTFGSIVPTPPPPPFPGPSLYSNRLLPCTSAYMKAKASANEGGSGNTSSSYIICSQDTSVPRGGGGGGGGGVSPYAVRTIHLCSKGVLRGWTSSSSLRRNTTPVMWGVSAELSVW